MTRFQIPHLLQWHFDAWKSSEDHESLSNTPTIYNINSPDLGTLVTHKSKNSSQEYKHRAKLRYKVHNNTLSSKLSQQELVTRQDSRLALCVFLRSRGNGCKSNDAIDSEGPNSGQKKMYFGKSSCQSGISKSRSYVLDILCILKYPSCDLYCINYSNPGTLQPFHQNTRQQGQLTLITSSSPNDTSAASASSSSCRLS